MGKVNGSGTCWAKYSGGDGFMFEDELKNFYVKELRNRSDVKNISNNESWQITNKAYDYLESDGYISQSEFNDLVNMINNALASGESGGSSGGGSSGGGGSSSGGRSDAEKQKDKIRNTKEYQRLDRGEKDRVLREMDNRAGGGITDSEYNDVFNKYVLPFD